MFPKGTVKAAVTPAEKPLVTAQKESAVVYMVANTDSQVVAVNDPYWRTQRARICACAVVLTTLILVAGTLGGITIVLTHKNGVETTDPTSSLNHNREPLLSNEVPLPKLPESTIRIKIDDGGLFPPTEPATPDLIAIDDVTDDSEIELLPSVSLSSSDYESSVVPSYHRGRNYISSSFPYDGWYAHGQEGIPPWERDSWIGPSERAREETDMEVSGDDQEKDYVSGEPDPTLTLNHDRESLLSKEVPLPKLPEPTIRIKIDDGGLIQPTEPATPDLIAIDDVTDDNEIKLLSSVSLSSSDDESESSVVPSYHHGRNYISSSFPYDGWYANGQEGTPPWERDSWIGPSERAREETDMEVSGDDQENDYGSGEPDSPTPDTNVDFPDSSSDAYHWRSHPSDGITADSSLDWYDYGSST